MIQPIMAANPKTVVEEVAHYRAIDRGRASPIREARCDQLDRM
jgi:hypothetical protein